MLTPSVLSNMVSQDCRCNELEERNRKAEVTLAELELELQKQKDHCVALETKVKTLESEKFGIEEELRVLKMSNDGFKKQSLVCGEKERVIEDDLAEDNVAAHLKIENKVLECEKKKAESEVTVWKEKYRELESWALQLKMKGRGDIHDKNGKEQENKQTITDGNLHLKEKGVNLGNDMQSAGTPPCGIFQRSPIVDSMVQPGREVRKQLTFESEDSEDSPGKKMAPPTLIGAKSTSVNVIIIDSDDEPNITQDLEQNRQGSLNISHSTCSTAENGKNRGSSCAQIYEENLDFGAYLTFAATPKRKRTCNVIMSESESDDDDNVPIGKLKRVHFQELSSDQVRRDLNSSQTATVDTVVTNRRLRPLSKFVSKSQDDEISSGVPHKVEHQQSIPTNADDDESEEDLSYSEGGNMRDFIVDDSDISNCEETSSKLQDGSNDDVDSDSSNSQNSPDSNEDSDSRDVSDGGIDFGKILSKIQRRKNNKMKWEFEADMLAAFGKDAELCMKAVCALYRQQTCGERIIKGTFCHNQRGFSKFDARRGSTLAEFLTDGDPHGGLNKTVEELQGYDPKAVELCRSLAIHYSKQLYEIYKNKEDPFFP